jgi:simple sugar transport system substrate-binding protein
MPNFLRGGLKEGYVKMSPYGPAVGAPARKKADDTKAAMLKGDYIIFAGGLKDNKGATVVPAGKGYEQTNGELEKMNYLVEGVVGSIPG